MTTATASGLPEGFTYTATASSEPQTNAGTTDSTVTSYSIFAPDGTDVTSLYDVTLAKGTVTVSKATLTISSAPTSKPYDGSPIDPPVEEVPHYEGLVDGEEIEVYFSDEDEFITDVGTMTRGFYIEWTDANKENYTVVDNMGTLAITKATLTISSTPTSEPYSGWPIVPPDEVPHYEGLAEGEEIEVYFSDEDVYITDVGSMTPGYEIEWYDTNPENYTVVPNMGTLTITEAPITIHTPSDSKTYDGYPLSCPTTDQPLGLAEGEELAINYTGSRTDYGSSQNTYEIDWDSSTAKKKNYKITDDLGTLMVNKATLTISNTPASKTYDSTPLTAGTPNVTGLVKDESITVTYEDGTGSITNIGSVTPAFVISWTNAKEDNYTVNPEPGKLTINANVLTIDLGGGDITVGEGEAEGVGPKKQPSVSIAGTDPYYGATSGSVSSAPISTGSNSSTWSVTLNLNPIVSGQPSNTVTFNLTIFWGEYMDGQKKLTYSISEDGGFIASHFSVSPTNDVLNIAVTK